MPHWIGWPRACPRPLLNTAAFAAALFQRLSPQQLNDARSAVALTPGLPFNFPLGNTADSSRAQWLLGPRRAYLVARLAFRAGDSAAAATALRVPADATPAERSTIDLAGRLAYAERALLNGDARRGLALRGDAPPQACSSGGRIAPVYRALWKDCDPSLRPLVDEATRRLGAR